MNKKISDILPKTEILAQAALKLRRALDDTNPTPKSIEECRKAFEEEYADVMVCMVALGASGDGKAHERIEIISSEKYYRWLHRLQDKEQPDE